MRPEIIHLTEDVFGINRDIPLNYVARNGVDDELVNSLKRDKHVVIFGGSKQGKTCLRKKCLDITQYIIIHCSNTWAVDDINANILKRAGFEITQSTKKSASGKHKINASISSKIIGILEAKLGSEVESSDTQETVSVQLELDIEDVNDIIAALNQIGFNKHIVLEDFHYLPQETQVHFSTELKAFHENSKHCFVIVGVWSDENRITVYNGDLTSRLISVNADRWSYQELLEVITVGEQLLNVSFPEEVKEAVINASFDNVFIVQEACYQICKAMNINQTQDNYTVLDVTANVGDLVKRIVNQQSGRYNSFLVNFAEGFQDTTLQMHRWLLYPVITTSTRQLEAGLKYSEIRRALEAHHPRGNDLNMGNLTQALRSTTSLQTSKDVKPIILDYDETNLRLNVVDKGFLIWLQYQDSGNLLELVGLSPQN